MKRIPWKNQWLLSLGVSLALGGVIVSISAARAVSGTPEPTPSVRQMPLPALDRMVAKLAAEARARSLAANTDRVR
jgi:hypothetical protein